MDIQRAWKIRTNVTATNNLHMYLQEAMYRLLPFAYADEIQITSGQHIHLIVVDQLWADDGFNLSKRLPEFRRVLKGYNPDITVKIVA